MARSRRLGSVGAGLALVVLLSGPASAGAPHARATFVDAAGNTVGWARLVEDATGVVHLNVHVEGMASGLHGIHVHAVGACSPTFAAAGGHYNPFGDEHGLDNPAGPHAGDLPNLIINGAGMGHLDATTDRVTISAGPATLFDTTVGAVVMSDTPYSRSSRSCTISMCSKPRKPQRNPKPSAVDDSGS